MGRDNFGGLAAKCFIIRGCGSTWGKRLHMAIVRSNQTLVSLVGCLAQVKRLKWLETVRCVQAGTLHRTGRSSVQRYATSGCHLRSAGSAGAGVWDMLRYGGHLGHLFALVATSGCPAL